MLKTDTFKSETLGRTVEIQELSAKAFIALREAGEMGTVVACKYGVVEWRELTADQIAEQEPMRVINELFPAICKLSGIGEDPNFESDPSDDSFSDSPSLSVAPSQK